MEPINFCHWLHGRLGLEPQGPPLTKEETLVVLENLDLIAMLLGSVLLTSEGREMNQETQPEWTEEDNSFEDGLSDVWTEDD